MYFNINSRSSIIEKFEKAKEKYQYYVNPIEPDTTIATLQKRWRSLPTIEAIQSVNNQANLLEDEASKLTSTNVN